MFYKGDVQIRADEPRGTVEAIYLGVSDAIRCNDWNKNPAQVSTGRKSSPAPSLHPTLKLHSQIHRYHWRQSHYPNEIITNLNIALQTCWVGFSTNRPLSECLKLWFSIVFFLMLLNCQRGLCSKCDQYLVYYFIYSSFIHASHQDLVTFFCSFRVTWFEWQ